jgi:hypothetical protein
MGSTWSTHEGALNAFGEVETKEESRPKGKRRRGKKKREEEKKTRSGI